MRVLALLAVAALAGCDRAAPVPEATPTVAPEAVATPRAIGTTSGLTGTTSGLSGAISDFVVERTDFGTRVQLAADSLFDFDKATLTPAAQTNLARTADLVRRGGAGTVTVTGFTDSKGNNEYNLDLALRRAEAVIAWFKAQPGLAERVFAVVSKGESEPIAPNTTPDGRDDPAGRAKNRRVVVDIPK